MSLYFYSENDQAKKKYNNYCSKCHSKHYPPRGKKCQVAMDKASEDPSISRSHMKASSDSDSDLGMGASKVNMDAKKKITKQKDCSVKRVLTPGPSRTSDLSDGSEVSEDECPSSGLQALILKEFQRVHHRLDDVEAKVQDPGIRSRKRKDCSKLRSSKYLSKNDVKCKNFKKCESSETSSDEELLPPLSVLKSSLEIQRKVDIRISEIEAHSKVQGNESSKLKSKRGGGVDVLVSKKVAWPHDSVLGVLLGKE